MSTILVKASAFISFIAKHVGDHYVYGTVGQTYSLSLARSREAMYGVKMGDGYYCKLINKVKDFFKGICSAFYGKWVADCSGLVRAGRKACGGGDVSASANGVFGQCVKTGPIATMPHIPGILLFVDDGSSTKPHKCHVGIYIGAGQVIQAAGARTGIIKGKMSRSWTNWGVAGWMMMDLPADGLGAPDPNEPGYTGDGSSGKPGDTEFDPAHVPYLKRGDKGPMVIYLQECIVKKGYKLPKSTKPDGSMDGDFGGETEKNFAAFQKANGLEVDMICGPLSWSKLLGIPCH